MMLDNMGRRATVIRRRLQAPVMVLESGHGDGGEVNRARQRGLLGFRRVPGCMQRLKALIGFLESWQQDGDSPHRTADE